MSKTLKKVEAIPLMVELADLESRLALATDVYEKVATLHKTAHQKYDKIRHDFYCAEYDKERLERLIHEKKKHIAKIFCDGTHRWVHDYKPHPKITELKCSRCDTPVRVTTSVWWTHLLYKNPDDRVIQKAWTKEVTQP